MLATVYVLLLTAGELANAMERRLFDISGGPFDMSGFYDIDTRELVIPLRFERVRKFSEGLAAVRDKGLWGYIDMTGAWAITPRFELADDFHNGLAAIEAGKFIGVIDRTGKIVIEPQFARVEPFTSDIVIATEGEVGPRGVYPGFETVGGAVGVDARRGLYQIGRGWITDASLRVNPFDPSRGLFWARPKEGGLSGIMRLDGSWFLEPSDITGGEPLRDGIAIVHGWEKAKPNNIFLTGAVDAKGRLVMPLKDWRFQRFSDESPFIRVNQGAREGRIDGKGRLLGERLFDEIDGLNEGFAVRTGDTWQFLSEQGELSPLREDAYDRKVQGVDWRLRRVAKDKYRIIEPDGAPTTPETFDMVYGYGTAPFPVMIGKRFDDTGETRLGYVDAHGRLVGPGLAFQMISQFNGDRALAQQDGKWGLIDPSGRFVVKPVYDSLTPTGHFPATSGLGMVSPGPKTERAKNEPWRLFVGVKDKQVVALDRNGAEQPLSPDDDPRVPPASKSRLETKGGLRFAVVDGLWGMTDLDGKWIIAPKYRALHDFQQGVAWAPIDEERRWCPVGPDGIVRDKPACVAERYPFLITHSWPEKLAEDRYESSVLWSLAYLETLAGVRAEGPKMVGDGVRGGTGLRPVGR
jgi:WG containing repeat